ncbi:MAG: Rrf2 family transcriptional regulator [Bacteroidales bacterium]
MSKIFNISEAATIGIHSMALIAKSTTSINACQIADITGFSKNHISKILQQLVKNGVLTSTRGPKGGFILKKKAEEINLMDIYRIIEGDITYDTACRVSCEDCPFDSCILGGFKEKFSTEFREYLVNKKLSMV